MHLRGSRRFGGEIGNFGQKRFDFMVDLVGLRVDRFTLLHGRRRAGPPKSA